MTPANRAYLPFVGAADDEPLQVSQAISLCNALFSELSLKVEGEVAGVSVSRGKFVFFDLKDEKEEARVGCFMMLHQLSVPLEDGMRVVVVAKPGLYQKSGQFRLTVSRVEPKGEGSVKRAFELLKQKLEKEGLFSPERKRPLPRYPERVGIISSSEAAGFGDFQRIAFQRLPGVRFVLANVAVQGADAEKEICQAFDTLNGYYDLDLIVLIRGGGSMEDLHAFNSECVARSIVRSKVPVVTGVGHERDVTIADLCADLRAATPSNAAQLILPEGSEVRLTVEALAQSGRLEIEKRVQRERDRLASSVARFGQAIRYLVSAKRERTAALLRAIDALSPQQTLKRGYTITCGENGKTLLSASEAMAGSHLTTRFADGTITSTVT